MLGSKWDKSNPVVTNGEIGGTANQLGGCVPLKQNYESQFASNIVPAKIERSSEAGKAVLKGKIYSTYTTITDSTDRLTYGASDTVHLPRSFIRRATAATDFEITLDQTQSAYALQTARGHPGGFRAWCCPTPG